MQRLIDEIRKTSGDMARLGWAESNGGNISLRLNTENFKYFNDHPAKSDLLGSPLPCPKSAVKGLWLSVQAVSYETLKFSQKKHRSNKSSIPKIGLLPKTARFLLD
jgi:ribulose-5-phosphate 4-epimerase/fuculose-1-phosphate aldolase